MNSLGETYGRASGPTAATGQQQSSPEVSRESDECSTLSPRVTLCFGDVIAVFFGGVVFCLGVTLWVSPTIGLFGESGIGMQRLAELTTSLGINTIVIWGSLLYSLTYGTHQQPQPQPQEQPRYSGSSIRLSDQRLRFMRLLDQRPRFSIRLSDHLEFEKLRQLIAHYISEDESHKL